ncbi:hypothetical protein BC937DRAFT_95206, partial [Endogone sp. FLAS-F59071]
MTAHCAVQNRKPQKLFCFRFPPPFPPPSQTSCSMEESQKPKLALVVYSPPEANIAIVKQTLASEFPNHSSIIVAFTKPDKKRVTYINFDSQEAYDQAALRVGETISLCGSTTTITRHTSKPPQQNPKLPPHPEQSSSNPNPVSNQPPIQPPIPISLEKFHLWYFWDIENVQIPKRISVEAAYVHDLVTAIRKHCENLYPNHMHMDFSVMHAQQILSNTAREGLQLCNVIVQQYAGKPIKKEQADKFIVTTMNTKEHLTKEYYENRVFVIITNDGGYQNDLNLLREKGIIIILIHGAQASPIFRRSVDYCIPCDKIFASVKTPNANMKNRPQLKPDFEDKMEGLQGEHQTFPVPSRSRSRSRSHADRSGSKMRGKSREPPQPVPSRSYTRGDESGSRMRGKSREPPQPVPSRSYTRGDESGSRMRGRSREPQAAAHQKVIMAVLAMCWDTGKILEWHVAF